MEWSVLAFRHSHDIDRVSEFTERSRTKLYIQRRFWTLLKIYTKSQHLTLDNGNVIPWIDENLNPFTGDWISRTMLKNHQPKERGRNYNHSSFCDLVISGLVGIRPQSEDVLIVNPLIPEDKWDYFALDHIMYHHKKLCILYDKAGKKL